MKKYLNLEGLGYLCGKIKADLDSKQNQLSGQPGQLVGFCRSGLSGINIIAGNNVKLVQSDSELVIGVDMDNGTNPNLLDNWYFLDPINQRGQTEYTGAGYTIDRWRVFGEGSVKVQDNGIVIQKASGAAHITFEIRIEDFRVPASETVTISAVVNGTLITASGKIGSGIKASGFTSNSLDRIEAYDISSIPEVHIVRFVIVSERPHVIKAAKLELGSVQTLAHQDTEGNWVLNDAPPDKTLELLKCQRYYQVFASQELRPVKAADFRPAMRINPAFGTLVLDGKTYYIADANL